MNTLTTDDLWVANAISQQLPFEFECVRAEDEADDDGWRYVVYINEEPMASINHSIYMNRDGDFDLETDVWVDDSLSPDNVVRRTINVI
jgi:hypothetical protein